MNYQHENHPIPPLYDKDSSILILGSFPSVKSREARFFYHHPQNRFWKVLAFVFDEKIPESIPQKEEMLHRNHIALWDVIASCDIIGSGDSSIKNVTVNDLTPILLGSFDNREDKQIRIFTNGEKSYQLYKKYMEEIYHIPSVKLPSTSPANAAMSLEVLCKQWKEHLLDQYGMD